jgi:quercetin dioxygenase-like cupin family protein
VSILAGMEIIAFDAPTGRPVHAFGSSGLRASHLVHDEDLAVTVLHVAAGGEIGSHPATDDQLFLVTAGRGEVCGGDGAWRPVATGQAVLWRGGEVHTTRAHEDLTAVVVEARRLRPATRGGT